MQTELGLAEKQRGRSRAATASKWQVISHCVRRFSAGGGWARDGTAGNSSVCDTNKFHSDWKELKVTRKHFWLVHCCFWYSCCLHYFPSSLFPWKCAWYLLLLLFDFILVFMFIYSYLPSPRAFSKGFYLLFNCFVVSEWRLKARHHLISI